MGRELLERLCIEGTLTAQTPLHVGGYGDHVDTDLPLARNGDGVVYIPGTSLAGVLRAWCAQALGEDRTRKLWGFQPATRSENATGAEVTGWASAIWVDDAPVALPEGALMEIRDGVGIDRVTSAAATAIKYDRAVLPRGTRLTLSLTVEIEATPRLPKPEIEAIIGHLLRAMSDRPFHLGAARTRGLGRVTFDLSKLQRQPLMSRAGMLNWLLGGDADTVSVEALIGAETAVTLSPQPGLEIDVVWEPVGPLMVQAGYEGMGVDILPLMSAGPNGLTLVLPGSSVKGALRSQAERIVRTLLGRSASRAPQAGKRFLEQLDDLPLIGEIFGGRAQAQAPGGDGAAVRPGRGALAVADCYAEAGISPALWRRVVMPDAEPNPDAMQQDLVQALSEIDAATESQLQFEEAHHVAIDRWTGGAAEGMLYNVLIPTQVVWQALHLSLDVQRLPARLRLPGLALLLLTLRDLMQNRIPLGFATHRGMGEIRVTHLCLVGRDLQDSDLVDLTDMTLQDEALGDLPPALRERLTEAWQGWLDAAAAPGGDA